MVAMLFYVDTLPDTGAVAVVDGDEGFHAATVRRIRPGEQLVLGDGVGRLARCVVEQAGRGGLRARVLRRWSVPPVRPPVTVVQALPKSERSELAIELATEAGADAFLAWQAARCVANWDGGACRQGFASVASGGPLGGPAISSGAHPAGRRRVVDANACTACPRRGGRRRGGAGPARGGDRADCGYRCGASWFVDARGWTRGWDRTGRACRADRCRRVAVRLGPTVLRTSTAAAVALGAVGVLTSRWDASASDCEYCDVTRR